MHYIGPNGAGHFVKIVHNGIEYGDMQLICEAYNILKNGLGLGADELHETFTKWNEGDLDSFLIEITGKILGTKDPVTGEPIVEVILDRAGQKGTGQWTISAALERGIPVDTMSEAVFARCISAIKEERVVASKQIGGPAKATFDGDKAALVQAVRDSLYASKICSYAQGSALMRAAGEELVLCNWRGFTIVEGCFGAVLCKDDSVTEH